MAALRTVEPGRGRSFPGAEGRWGLWGAAAAQIKARLALRCVVRLLRPGIVPRLCVLVGRVARPPRSRQARCVARASLSVVTAVAEMARACRGKAA